MDSKHPSTKPVSFSSIDSIKSKLPSPSQIMHGSATTEKNELGIESRAMLVLKIEIELIFVSLNILLGKVPER